MGRSRKRVLGVIAAALAVWVSPVAGIRPSAIAAAVTRCPSAPYGVSRSAPATAAKTVALTFDDGPGRDTTKM